MTTKRGGFLESVDAFLGDGVDHAAPSVVNVHDMKFDGLHKVPPSAKKGNVPLLAPPPGDSKAAAVTATATPSTARAVHTEENEHLWKSTPGEADEEEEQEEDKEDKDGDPSEKGDEEALLSTVTPPVARPVGVAINAQKRRARSSSDDNPRMATDPLVTASTATVPAPRPERVFEPVTTVLAPSVRRDPGTENPSPVKEAVPEPTQSKASTPAAATESKSSDIKDAKIEIKDARGGTQGIPAAAPGKPDPPRPPRPSVPQKSRVPSIRTALILSAISLLFLLVILAWLLDIPSIQRKLQFTPGTESIPELGRMCNAPTPAMNLPMPGTPGAIDIFSFGFLDVVTNQTSIVYIHRKLNVQVTNTLERGVIVYTEVIDFDAERVAIYPEGRNGLGSSRPANDPCVLLPVTDEKNWADISCFAAQGKRLAMDMTQMQLDTPVTPILLPESFFTVPATCPPLDTTVYDETRNRDLSNILQLVLLQRQLPNITLSGIMLQDVLVLIQAEFGSSYAQEPELLYRLESAQQRIGLGFLNATLGQVLQPAPLFANHSQTQAWQNCCPAQDAECAIQVESRPGGLGLLCTHYRDCLATQDAAWFTAHAEQWPMTSCNLDEHRCYCDFNLASALETPGQTRCGDCLDDQFNCDCYVYAWLLKFALSRRPCWCQGLCPYEPFPYICRAEESCNGWMSTDCEVIVHWCERQRSYPCSLCHQAPSNDHDSHCGSL